MSTETLPRFSRTKFDSPWERVYWTLPSALLICALALTWFAYSMEHPTKRTLDPTPVNAEIVELPEPPRTTPVEKKAVPPEPKHIVQPRQSLPQPALQSPPPQPAKAVPPAVAPPPALPVATQPLQGETRGAMAMIQPLPIIPDELRQEVMSVEATARFYIAPDGSVKVQLIKPSPNPRINRLLLDTLSQWKFFPAMKDGKPVTSVEDKIIRVNVQ